MAPLMILVAGPYRSGTNDEPALKWFALPLIEHAGSSRIGDPVFDEIFHPISRRLVAKCDGCLRIGGQSAGADEMVSLAKRHGKAVSYSLAEIPGAS